MIKLVIFDCDGVLIDSEFISAVVLINELRAINIKINFDYVLKNFIGRSFLEVAAQINDSFNSCLPLNFEERYSRKLLDEFRQKLKTTTGVEKVLKNLNVKSCVATSSSPKRVARSLEFVNLDNFFGRNVFTVSEVNKGKPAPDLFLHAAQVMRTKPEECLVIEDSIYGIQAAYSAGMEAIQYTGGSHYSQSLRPNDIMQPSVTSLKYWSNFYLIKPELKSMCGA